ncbi:hypothetical protein LZP69_09125 [Shewanella sp. AS1]|uniref:hypothetical protein n=1 Tax=Shewanella sp. AS1 TaxID=2907626 RepID=UPI001F3E4B6B|nr:hypothetical protein [Shewanella sp. AS1]MCE9679335.1 hypothetical protein [Shewanella sp. AS1]
MKLIIQIALGILLAGVVVAVGELVVISYAAYQADLYLKQQSQLAQQKLLAQQEAEKQRKIEAYKKKYLAEQKSIQTRRKAADEYSKRQRAWKSYYVTPESCKSFKNEKHMVECINHKAEAKQEFDRLYATGNMIIPPPSRDQIEMFNFKGK